jgi:hypothetical protein
MDNEQPDFQWAWYQTQPDYFYSPNDDLNNQYQNEYGDWVEMPDALEQPKYSINLGVLKSDFLDSEISGDYYFPDLVAAAVRTGLYRVGLREEYDFGNLVYLFFKISEHIKNIRFPYFVTDNPDFERERKGLLNLIELLEKDDKSLLTASFKVQGKSAENDIILNDEQVLFYLKKALVSNAEQARDRKTLAYQYKINLESTISVPASQSRRTLVPLTPQEFKRYYEPLCAIINLGSDYRRLQFMSHVLLALKCLDNNELEIAFKKQRTYDTLERYLQEKLVKKMA